MPTKIMLPDDGVNEVYEYFIPDYTDELLIIPKVENQKDQRWKKLPYNNKMSDAEKSSFVNKVDFHLEHGGFFWNNGNLEYINGNYFRFLQLYEADFIPVFIKEQQKLAYFHEICNKDEKCFGYQVVKPRRCGNSQYEISECVGVSTSGKFRRVGVMSTDLKKAKETLFEPLAYLYDNYNEHFKPLGESGKIKISYDDPNKENKDTTSSLGGFIRVANTTVKGFDGNKLNKFLFDEYSKLIGKDPTPIISAHKECLYDPFNDKIIGKMALTSTLGIDDRGMKQAIECTRTYWHGSNPRVRNESGRTSTGLYRYFISALDTMGIDEYGYPNHEKAERLIAERINDAISKHGEGSEEHIAEIRHFPKTIDLLFEDASMNNSFGKRPSERLRVLKAMPASEKRYIKGEWKIDAYNKVWFDTENYNNDCYWKVDGLNIDKPNNFTYKEGLFVPPRNPEGIIGYDPVRYDEYISNHISQGAGLALKLYDHYSNTGEGAKLVAQYYGRTETDEMHKQIFYCALYFGFLVNPERQVEGALNWAKNNGFLKFVMKSPYDSLKCTLGNTPKVLRDGIPLITDLMKEPTEDYPYDFLDELYFEETAEQLSTFNPKKYTTHDLIASLLMCAVQVKAITPTLVRGNGLTSVLMKQMMGV
jgi:hypothetical protein